MKSWKRKLRMGMVGGGQGAFIGAVHRLAAQMDGQCELLAGCFSRDWKNTQRTGRELYLDPRRVYATYSEMAAREAALPPGERIDFAAIVTPNNSHYAIAKTFLQAGIHVALDKPMTARLADAEKLVALVEKTKRVFLLTHNYTGSALVRHARDLVRSGALGPVRKVIVEYLQDFLVTALEKQGQKQAAWRMDPKQSGAAGTFGDIGTHGESLLHYITGDPIVALCADLTAFVPGRRLDDDANVLLRMKSGGKGVLTVSQVAPGEENGFKIRIYGAKGMLRWAQENPNDLEVCLHGEPRKILGRGHANYLSPAATACSRIPPGHPEGYLEAFANIYGGFFEALRRHLDGRPMPPADYDFPTVYDGLRGMQFVACAVESSRGGAVWLNM